MSQYDPIDTHSQDRARHESDAREQQARLLEQDDLRWLMSDKRGRRLAWRWLDRAGVWRLSFSTDALATAFREGGRNQGLMLLTLLLATCPKPYNLMMEEAHDDGNLDL